MSRPGGTDRPPIPHAACSSSHLKGGFLVNAFGSWGAEKISSLFEGAPVRSNRHSISRQPLGRLERPLSVANIAFPGGNPAGSGPMRLLRLLPSPHRFRDSGHGPG